ncbi:MAG: hypothetical protein F7B95_00705 [Desulfurococcales archaeon]|nr:hypothetical protein [Desulfurococcales archaeon]
MAGWSFDYDVLRRILEEAGLRARVEKMRIKDLRGIVREETWIAGYSSDNDFIVRLRLSSEAAKIIIIASAIRADDEMIELLEELGASIELGEDGRLYASLKIGGEDVIETLKRVLKE